MSPNLHEDIVELWDEVVPRLMAHLEKHTGDEWNQGNWEARRASCVAAGPGPQARGPRCRG